ncbi:hypothetical protein ES703_19690 [subsurface metagenome]
MAEKKVQCPHCNEIFKLDLPVVPAGQLNRGDIEDILKRVQSPGNLDHRHQTADEFLDCPECRLWVDKTAQRYQVIEKEPPAPGKQPGDQPGGSQEKAGEKEPEPAAARSAFGSVFSTKKEGEQ